MLRTIDNTSKYSDRFDGIFISCLSIHDSSKGGGIDVYPRRFKCLTIDYTHSYIHKNTKRQWSTMIVRGSGLSLSGSSLRNVL